MMEEKKREKGNNFYEITFMFCYQHRRTEN